MSDKKQDTAPVEEVAEETAETAAEPTELELAQAETEKVKAELAGEKDKYMRLMAEYDNFRKRSAREREALYADIKSDTLLKLLPVYDNLERAMAQPTADEAYRKGVEMTLRGMEDALVKLGMERVDANPGTAFDPEKHNAVMMAEADEEHPEGTIIECFQTGFMVKGKVVRYAMVRVAN